MSTTKATSATVTPTLMSATSLKGSSTLLSTPKTLSGASSVITQIPVVEEQQEDENNIEDNVITDDISDVILTDDNIADTQNNADLQSKDTEDPEAQIVEEDTVTDEILAEEIDEMITEVITEMIEDMKSLSSENDTDFEVSSESEVTEHESDSSDTNI